MTLLKLELDQRNVIVRTVYAGVTTERDLRDGQACVKRFIESHGPYSGITDFSAVTKFNVSSVEMRGLALLTPAIPTEWQKLVVAPCDLTFGMSRMFQMLCEPFRPKVQVVRHTEEAYGLLRATMPAFSELMVT
jgi:hypothetical protein